MEGCVTESNISDDTFTTTYIYKASHTDYIIRSIK